MRSLEDVRRQGIEDVMRTGELKQTRVTPFDRSVVAQACATWGLRRPIVIHPSVMMRCFAEFFSERAPLDLVLSRTKWDYLPRPDKIAGVPASYYAVGFYARATLAGSHAMVKTLSQIVHGLAERHPVVLLRNPHHLDDHHDLPFAGENVLTPDAAAPEHTLALNTSLIAHARAFVGTYGGLAQLALRLGRPSASYYETLQGTSFAHLYLSRWIAEKMGVPFYAFRMRDLGWLSDLTTKIDRHPEGSS
jgi:hypothetical protein